jgi:hypothetical protein
MVRTCRQITRSGSQIIAQATRATITEGKDRLALSYKSAYSPFSRGCSKNPLLRINLGMKSGKMRLVKVESDNDDFRTQFCQGRLS